MIVNYFIRDGLYTHPCVYGFCLFSDICLKKSLQNLYLERDGTKIKSAGKQGLENSSTVQ